MFSTPTLEDFERAANALATVVHKTPVERSHALESILGGKVHLKCENLQRTGSYKIRGAYTKIANLSEEQQQRGIVAASAGNHAQGVALASAHLGIDATVFMPTNVSLPKLDATKNYGARVVLKGADVGATLKAARKYAQDNEKTFIPPFDDTQIITGAGTVGLEIVRQVPDVETIVLPLGGGGLGAGVAVAAKLKADHPIRIIGVQSVQNPSYQRSLEFGYPATITIKPSIADGIAVNTPGAINFAIISQYFDDIVTVTDDQIAKAIILLLERAKLVVEGAGAVSVAAILAGKVPVSQSTVAILSGGNVDSLLLQHIITHGLTALQRIAHIQVQLNDNPGALANLATLLAATESNIVEVTHVRNTKDRSIGEAELQLLIETKGSNHLTEVIKMLKKNDFSPILLS